MSWGTAANVTTNNLNSSTDDPSQARVELYNALIELIAVINGRGAANGVASLSASSKIPSAQLPDTISSSSGQPLLLSPSSGRVTIEDILKLTPLTVSELEALTAFEGDIAYCSNGAAGSKCLAVYNGTDWKVVSFGATISST
jgi:hypothetical protein